MRCSSLMLINEITVTDWEKGTYKIQTDHSAELLFLFKCNFFLYPDLEEHTLPLL